MKHKEIINKYKEFIGKFDLQKFAEPISGAKIIYLFRIFEEAATEDATLLAFQTEGTETITKDADSTATKSGNIRVPNPAEVEVSLTALLSKGDKKIKTFRNAMKEGKLIECWSVNLEEAGTSTNEGKYEATYYQGYLTTFEQTANAEDFAEYSIDFGANGNGSDGFATVTTEQMEAAQYVFKDTVKEEGD